MPDQLKWDTRLTVTVDGVAVTPIDSFNPTFNSPVQPLHSLEADNVAHIVQPKTFTFTMAVKAIGPAVAKLTKLGRDHTRFTLSVSEASGNDWTFSNIDFNDCYITSVASNTVIDGVPTTTFNCICLDLNPTAAP
jgi:type VI protein secretion system component Hcp